MSYRLGEDICKSFHRIKDLYLEYVKNSFNSIRHMTQLTKGKFSDILLQIYKWLTRTWKDAEKPLAIREIQMVSFFFFYKWSVS